METEATNEVVQNKNGDNDSERRRTRCLPCPMTDEERRDLGASIAKLVGDAEDLEAEKRSIASDYRARADKLAEKIQTKSRALRRGTVDRDVEVEVFDDLAHAERVVTRLDTGEVVERRTLSARELQELRQVPLPGMAWGVVATLAEACRVPILQVSPQELKLRVVGKKTASKEEVQQALEQRYGDLPWPPQRTLREHAADGLGAIVACLDSDVVLMARRQMAAGGAA